MAEIFSVVGASGCIMSQAKYIKGVWDHSNCYSGRMLGRHIKILADWYVVNRPSVKLRNIKIFPEAGINPATGRWRQSTIMVVYE